jgi:hypothetical protein
MIVPALTTTDRFAKYYSDRQVVGISMNLLDRFLVRCEEEEQQQQDGACPQQYNHHSTTTMNGNHNNSRNYQLSAMTCLYLTLKLHTRHYKRHLVILTELSRGQFIMHDVLAMENVVLAMLDWRVHPVTPMTFVQYFIQYYQYQQQPHQQQQRQLQHNSIEDVDESRTDREELSSSSSSSPGAVVTVTVWQVVQEIARYCTELAVLDCHHYNSAATSASQLAYACLLAAMDLLSEEALPVADQENFVQTVLAKFVPIPPSTRLQQGLSRLISPELLVAEHHGSHPIAMAWSRSWFRHHSGPAATAATAVTKPQQPHSNANSTNASSPPLSPIRPQLQQQRANASNTNNNGCFITTESPVSVL